MWKLPFQLVKRLELFKIFGDQSLVSIQSCQDRSGENLHAGLQIGL